MRVDFYRLSRDPAPAAVAMLARKVTEAGKRLLVVSGPEELRLQISELLWEAPGDAFLANGVSGGAHDARQPILISDHVDAVNGASFLILADGRWRDPGDAFERVMLLFDDATIEAARAQWKALGDIDGAERHFWKQDGGRWVEGP